MNTGVTYIEINYDSAWVNNALAGLQGFSWLYQWGMYLFLLATLGVLLWIFYDSITKKKDQKALVPRILAILGFFAVIPAFIFRFTGNADGVTMLVRLNAEPGAPYYAGPINWNVNWLVSGYGPLIAAIALVGVVLSIAALVIYASSVQRAKVDTVFSNNVSNLNSQVANLERKVDAVANNQRATAPTASRPGSTSAKTIIDRKPQAATIIDIPKTGCTLTVQTGSLRGRIIELPAQEIVIGRAANSFIVLDDGKVSARHAKLSYVGGNWSVFDMGSTNGTFVNGQRIVGQRQLENGDIVKAGDTELAFARAL